MKLQKGQKHNKSAIKILKVQCNFRLINRICGRVYTTDNHFLKKTKTNYIYIYIYSIYSLFIIYLFNHLQIMYFLCGGTLLPFAFVSSTCSSLVFHWKRSSAYGLGIDMRVNDYTIFIFKWTNPFNANWNLCLSIQKHLMTTKDGVSQSGS